MAGEIVYFDRLLVQKDGVNFVEEEHQIEIDLTNDDTSGGSQVVGSTPEALDLRDVTTGGVLRIWNHSREFTVSLRASASSTNGADIKPGERHTFRTAEGSVPYLVSPDGEARISFRILDGVARARTDLVMAPHACSATVFIGCFPIHVWRLDETSGTNAEDSVRELDGTHSTTAATNNHDGAIVNSAQYHDGDTGENRTALGEAAFEGENLDSDEAMSVSFWVQTDDATSEAHAVSYLTGHTGEGDYEGFSFGLDNGRPYVHFQRGDTITCIGSPTMPPHTCTGSLDNGRRIDGTPAMPVQCCSGSLVIAGTITISGGPNQPPFHLFQAVDHHIVLNGSPTMAAHNTTGGILIKRSTINDGAFGPRMPAHTIEPPDPFSEHMIIA